MKREMNSEEQEAFEKIFRELVGLTVEQAKLILAKVLKSLEEKAVIEE